MTAGFLRGLRDFPACRVTCTSAATDRSLKSGAGTALLGIRRLSLDWIDDAILVDEAERRAGEDEPEAVDSGAWRRDSWTRTTLPFMHSVRRYSMAGVDWWYCIAAIVIGSDDNVVKSWQEGMAER